MVRLLLKYGSNPSAPIKNERTPLDDAIENAGSCPSSGDLGSSRKLREAAQDVDVAMPSSVAACRD
jgi:hypothetical protein